MTMQECFSIWNRLVIGFLCPDELEDDDDVGYPVDFRSEPPTFS